MFEHHERRPLPPEMADPVVEEIDEQLTTDGPVYCPTCKSMSVEGRGGPTEMRYRCDRCDCVFIVVDHEPDGNRLRDRRRNRREL